MYPMERKAIIEIALWAIKKNSCIYISLYSNFLGIFGCFDNHFCLF